MHVEKLSNNVHLVYNSDLSGAKIFLYEKKAMRFLSESTRLTVIYFSIL